MNMALDEGCLFGIRRLLIWDYKAAYLGLQGCLFGITRLLIWDYKAAYLGLQGCLFGITRLLIWDYKAKWFGRDRHRAVRFKGFGGRPVAMRGH
jgi:hypothetical protein